MFECLDPPPPLTDCVREGERQRSIFWRVARWLRRAYLRRFGPKLKVVVADFTSFKFPRINATYPSIPTKDLTEVQPMTRDPEQP